MKRTSDFQTLRSEVGLLPPYLLRRVLSPRAKLDLPPMPGRDSCRFTATAHRTAAARSVESSVESSGKTRDQILDLLAARADMTIVQVAQVLGLSTRAIEKQVGKLQQEGLLRRVGPRKSRRWEVLRGGGTR